MRKFEHGGPITPEETRPLPPARAWATRIVATAFGLGYSPVAPGTAGSLLPMAVLLVWAPPRSWELLLVTAAIWLVGVPVAGWAEQLWRRQDPGRVCIDEVAGYLVAVLWVPATAEWRVAVAGFLAFRLFDIVKPPPARRMEFFPGGLGVMADDVVAGIYANLLLQVIGRAGWL